MKGIVTYIFVLMSALSQCQEIPGYNFSDSVEFYWPNNTLRYRYVNIYKKDSINNSSTTITCEEFFSRSAPRKISTKKFERKYGREEIDDLRRNCKNELEKKLMKLRAERAEFQKKKYEQDSIFHVIVLNELRKRCIECNNADSIKIKHKLFLNLGTSYFHTTLTKVDGQFHIRNEMDILDVETFDHNSSALLVDRRLESTCIVPYEDFLGMIDYELEKCWQMESASDYRWTFEFEMKGLRSEEITDYFGFHLYRFLSNSVCDR